MICSYCYKSQIVGKHDVGHWWNNPEGLAFACSEKCAEEAPKNWLSENPTILSKNKFKKERYQ